MKSNLTHSTVALTALAVIFAADASFGQSKKFSNNFSRSVRSQSNKGNQQRHPSQSRTRHTSNKQTASKAKTQQHRNLNNTHSKSPLHNYKSADKRTQPSHNLKKHVGGKYNFLGTPKHKPNYKPNFKPEHKPNHKPGYKPNFHPTYTKPHVLLNGRHRKPQVCLPKKDWCHTRPAKYHWWYNYCGPIRYYQPADCVRYTCNYVTANYQLSSGIVVEDARWHLGLGGILLPGKGFAIETVEENSPAAQAGLQPGMVITTSSGIEITDENSMPNAIAASNGLLQATVLVQIDAEPIEVAIQMRRVVVASF